MARRRPRQNPRLPSWPWWALGAGIVFFAARRASASESASDLIEDNAKASFYGGAFFDGRQTANQEIFNSNAMTAAHRTLPFNTKVLVTDLDTGAQVVVRINDRGPFPKDANGNFTRSIDLSKGAAEVLGTIQKGLARVRLERVS